MYDYLVVGSGLYGAIFAHEARTHGKSVLVVDKRPNMRAISILRTSRVSMFTNTALTFSIPTIKRSGAISHNLQNSTALPTVLWQITRVNCILYLSICTLSTRCGVL